MPAAKPIKFHPLLLANARMMLPNYRKDYNGCRYAANKSGIRRGAEPMTERSAANRQAMTNVHCAKAAPQIVTTSMALLKKENRRSGARSDKKRLSQRVSFARLPTVAS